MSTEEEIYKRLAGDETSREILGFCKSPKSAEEIMMHMWRYYVNVKGWAYKGVEDVRDGVGTRLNSLETIGALSYDESQNKWQTKEIALSVMRKYFGM